MPTCAIAGAMWRSVSSRPHQTVEALAVAPVDALLELGVDIHRHLRVGVADLAHHPLDVEVVGEQGDRDVRAPPAVGLTGGKGGRPRAARCLLAATGVPGLVRSVTGLMIGMT
jgi:hypothetical protein